MLRTFFSTGFVALLACAGPIGCGASTSDHAGNSQGGGSGMSTAAGGDAGAAASGTGGGDSGRGGSAGRGGSSGGSSGGSGGAGAGNGASAGNGGASAGSSGDAAGTGGSHAGTGGSTAGTGGSGDSGAGTGGNAGAAGACGACPPRTGIACLSSVTIRVAAATLTGVTVTVNQAPGNLDLRCFPTVYDPCTWTCSAPANLTAGDYSVTLSAPGYAPQTVEFTAEGPTNCGCCGCACAPTAYDGDIALSPGGDGTAAACCADLLGSTANCGTCGHACDTGTTCEGGECVFQCLTQGQECSSGPCCSGLMCCSPAPGTPIGCYPGC